MKLETSSPVNSRSPNMISKYSFSIMSGELSLLDLDAIHVYQFAEWTDGIAVLSPGENAAMRHKESLDKVRVSGNSPARPCPKWSRQTLIRKQILADVALKVRLLDITGDGIEMPEKVAVGHGESLRSMNTQGFRLTKSSTEKHRLLVRMRRRRTVHL